MVKIFAIWCQSDLLRTLHVRFFDVYPFLGCYFVIFLHLFANRCCLCWSDGYKYVILPW